MSMTSPRAVTLLTLLLISATASSVRVAVERLLVVDGDATRAGASALVLTPYVVNCTVARRGVFAGRPGCNGPSLIRAPAWLWSAHTYLLYYAHHAGSEIRVRGARLGPEGPWEELGPVLALPLGGTARTPPGGGHLASPHVAVDGRRRRLTMTFHAARCAYPLRSGKSCSQCALVAQSDDGMHFSMAGSSAVGCFYLHPFRLAAGSTHEFALMKRNNDGIALARRPANAPAHTPFEEGGLLLAGARHGVVVNEPGCPLLVVWSNAAACSFCEALRAGPPSPEQRALRSWSSAPGERLLIAPITLTQWPQWTIGKATELLAPTEPHEGALLPLARSSWGAAAGPERAVRDPAVLRLRAGEWLLAYATMGEPTSRRIHCRRCSTPWLSTHASGSHRHSRSLWNDKHLSDERSTCSLHRSVDCLLRAMCNSCSACEQDLRASSQSLAQARGVRDSP